MTWDPLWDETFRRRPWGRYPPEELIRFIEKTFQPPRDSIKVLEAGCACGANLWYLAREGMVTHGVDRSEVAIAMAKERLERECPGWLGAVHVADAGQLPYADATFDAVIDVEMLCHNLWSEARAICIELARVCKRNGKLFSKTFATGTWGDGIGTSVGHRAWQGDVGILAGHGVVRFTDLDEVAELISPFKVDSIEISERSVNNRSDRLREWIITGVRP